MAVPHLCVKYGSRQTGSSAKEQFNYICRLGAKAKDDLVSVSHQNYPAWGTPGDFHKATDIHSRNNARLYREIVVALPRELSQKGQLELVTKWAESELGKSHPYTIAVHSPLALDGKPNTHAHIMFSDRTLDGVERDPKLFFKRANLKNPELGGAAKSKDWNRKQKVVEIRQSWEKAHNLALEKAGIGREAAISMKSLKDQGITDRLPEPKLGIRQTAMLKQGRDNDNTLLVKALREVRNIEAALGGVQKEINQEIRHLAQAVVNSPLVIPANQIKSQVRDKKICLIEKLREAEKLRYKLGLIHTARGGVYSKSADPEVEKRRTEVEKQFSALTNQLASTKKFEKNLGLLGEIPILMEKGKSLSEEESLCDRPGFLQKIKEAKQQQKELGLSKQMQLQREPPSP